MCHPYTRITRDRIGRLRDRVKNNWEGAIQLYDKMRWCMFGSVEYGDENPEVEDVFERLYDAMYDRREALTRFVTYVRARAIIDFANSCGHDLLQKWVIGCNPTAYQPWDVLEDTCLLREDLDLHFVGSTTCNYRETLAYEPFCVVFFSSTGYV